MRYAFLFAGSRVTAIASVLCKCLGLTSSRIRVDWLGVDQHGHVAVFISWGWGPLPVGIDQHLDEVDAAMERIQGASRDRTTKP